MELTILGATGATGRELTRQALERGHRVRAVARRLDRIEGPPGDDDALRRVAGDVLDDASIARALAGSEVVLSGLGITKGDPDGTLIAGARAVIAAAPGRILWLGAIGTGASAATAGRLTRTVLRLAMGQEYREKASADGLILAAGGTVFHAGPLSTGPLSATRRTVALADAPARLVPAGISRATVAAAMLDEAEHPRFPASLVVPLAR